MDFGPNSDFVPHSPLSYSNSYAPVVSPIKFQQNAQQSVNQTKAHDVQQQNKSILKNPTASKYLANSTATRHSQSAEKKQMAAAPSLTRKGSLKTVAFGSTTNLDETVLGKEAKSTTAGSNRTTKTIIFSHEAQSLHKLITAQNEAIDELKRTVNELMAADQQHRTENRELVNIIGDLSGRLIEVEKRLAGSKRKIFSMEEKNKTVDETINIEEEGRENNEENGKINGNENGEKENGQKNDHDHLNNQNGPSGDEAKNEQRVLNQRNGPNKGKKMDEENNKKLDNHQQKELAIRMPRQRPPQNHEQFLQCLSVAMQNYPRFEERLHSVYRLWAVEDSASLANRPLNSIVQNPEEEQNSVVPSEVHMFRRTITQQEEVRFISASPNRFNNNRINRQPLPPKRNNARTKPIIQQLDDSSEEGDNHQQPRVEEEEEEEFEGRRVETMMPNVRRSEHCTDDAEFFQNEDDDQGEDEDDQNDENAFGQQRRNYHDRTLPPNPNNGRNVPNRRRKREADSTIRNRYK